METTASRAELGAAHATTVRPGSFQEGNHFYARVLNAQIHPLVAFFIRMSNAQIVERYCHLHPRVDRAALTRLLAEPVTHLQWAGADLFCTTTADGNRRIVVVETNSCPSGNKSMPPLSDDNELGGYRTVLEQALLPSLKKRGVLQGDLAVVFDKNYPECSGYAAALAELTGENVYLAPFPAEEGARPVRFTKGVLEVFDDAGRWRPIRAAFRYVTQRPWDRIPVRTRTRIVNPIIACLAGGRNKLLAAKAYDLYNAQLAGTGLAVCIPETIADVSKPEIPMVVERFGGHAVVKVPYSNAGQGVFPILNRRELRAFMGASHPYDRFVVQSLVGNYRWSSTPRPGAYYHVGTMPDRQGDIYVADLRMMVCSGPSGFRPIAVYARRAAQPLPHRIDERLSSWSFLGTNLSGKAADGSWTASTERLVLMDRKDFNQLGIGCDDLIEAYIQAVLATRAIDQMADSLLTRKGAFRYRLFGSLNEDPALIAEIRKGTDEALLDCSDAETL